MRKKAKTFLLLTAALIAAIVITLTIFVKILITPERVRVFLITKAEKALNRKVEAEEIKISLFKRIEIKDFAIKEEDKKTDFIKCKDFVLKYKLLPLLARKVIIEELKLVSPEIRIERDSHGNFNFEGIGKKQKEKKVEKEPEDRAKTPPFSLSANKITVRDARFSLTDIKGGMPEIKTSVDIDMGIKSAEGSGLFSQGEIDARFDEILFKKSSRKYRDIALEFRYAFTVDQGLNRLNIDKIDLKIQEVPVLITGTITNLGASPEIDIRALVPETKNDIIQKSFSPFFDTKQISINSLTADLRLAGIPKKLTTLKSEGEIKTDSAKYKGIVINNLYTKYQLKDGKLELKRLSAVAGKGKFNLHGTVDLTVSSYTYGFFSNLDSLSLDEIVNSFFPKAKDSVSGILTADLKLRGAGTSPEDIKKNLLADGSFKIINGKITKSKITDNLALFLGIDELKVLNMKQAEGMIKIKDRKARLDSIFSSDDISMNPSGNIGLDETLDIAFDLKLSPRLTDKALKSPSVSSYIKDEEGWGRIPLKVTGTFTKPSYSIDIAKAGGRIIKKKATELIEDIFKKDKDETGGTDDRKQDIKKPVEDLLKGLFR